MGKQGKTIRLAGAKGLEASSSASGFWPTWWRLSANHNQSRVPQGRTRGFWPAWWRLAGNHNEVRIRRVPR